MKNNKIGIGFSLLVLTAFVTGLYIGPTTVQASLGTRARMSSTSASSSVLSSGTTGTDLTLTPGALSVGALGMSSDAGLKLTGTASTLQFFNASFPLVFDPGGAYYLAYATGTLTSSMTHISNVGSGTNAFACSVNGSRIDFGAGASDYASSDGTTVTFAGPIISSAAQTKGVKSLTGGTGTVTVIAGSVCNCSLNTSAGTAAPKCSVSSTTLTITGTGTDSINYVCL